MISVDVIKKEVCKMHFSYCKMTKRSKYRESLLSDLMDTLKRLHIDEKCHLYHSY